ncbi:hypothetical protein [Myxococcus sp. RHSTA-1-4]|uniref:hypothetical protein n=1 Tax=Myxococcus sp. RHSTA-1-4 TaxID=2874601 RepID=UPI001CBB0EDC|nr:hypothetical protein [Myxococcus sp. RHSTA-1-4]MBZ4421723.1 hypothetical protein [Myxococcus sp. RHSTA-1-4]
MHKGSASILRALVPHFDLPPAELASRIFRAPAVLAGGLPETLATELSEALRGAGLDVVVEPDGAEPPAAGPSFDVALYVRDGARFREACAELVTVLGCTQAEAAAALCATPATVLGAVSQATVDALRARFTPLGVEVDASHAPTARYDIFYVGSDASGVAVVRPVLEALGVTPGEPPLLASNLDHAKAERVWRELGSRGLVRVLDHAFQRFDVSLVEAPAGADFARVLIQETGMPEALVPRVLSRLPVVLHAGLRREDVAARSAALEAAGAKLSVQLVSFRSFRLRVDETKDPGGTSELLSAALNLPASDVRTALSRLPHTFTPPVGDTRARWLVAELRSRGTRASLVEP